MTMAYAGRVPGCGCLVAATIDNPERKKDVAKFVQEMIRDGLEVSRVDTEEVRLTMQTCVHGEGQDDLFSSDGSHTADEEGRR